MGAYPQSGDLQDDLYIIYKNIFITFVKILIIWLILILK